jgi:hypothetical protein
MKQTIFASNVHKYIWLPLFEDSILLPILAIILLCALSLVTILNLPSVTLDAQYRGLVILIILLVSAIAWRNKASGQYYGEAQAIPRVCAFALVVFASYIITGTIFVLTTNGEPLTFTGFLDQHARRVISSAAVASLATSATSFIWPAYGNQIREFGRVLSGLVRSLNEPLSLWNSDRFREFQQSVDRAAEALSKVSAMALPNDSRDAVRRLSKCISDLQSWLTTHPSALIVRENTQLMGRLESFKEMLSRG